MKGVFMTNNENKNYPIIEITQELVEQKTYLIRGQKVMLDFDLAEIYGYETKTFNQQVKNNIDKFPSDFMFKLNSSEFRELTWSKNLTTFKEKFRRKDYLPCVFTEKGIYMLMTVLKGELAIKQTIELIRVLKNLKDYYLKNESEKKSFTNIYKSLSNQEQRISVVESKLEIMMNNFNCDGKRSHYLILKDQRIEADVAFQEIYSKANYSIIIIDNYISIKTLSNLKKSKSNVEIIICSDIVGNQLSKTEFDDFKKDTGLSIKSLKIKRQFMTDI